jgi:hypothetical protein
LSSVICVEAGVRITYVNKAKRLVSQLRIVRLADLHY